MNLNFSPEQRINKKWPKLQEFYKAYDYTSPDVAVPKKDLGLEWGDDFVNSAVEAVRNGITQLETREFFEQIQPQSQGVSFIVKTTRFPQVGVTLGLLGPDREAIAMLYMTCKASQRNTQAKERLWFLKHRITFPPYRDQGIGFNLLKVLEQGISQESSFLDDSRDVFLVDAQQVGLLILLDKSGYKPATPEDDINLQLVLSMDKSKVLIITAPGSDNDGISRPGFMFSISHLQEIIFKKTGKKLTAEQVRDFDLSTIFRTIKDYFENGLTVNMRKDSKAIRTQQ